MKPSFAHAWNDLPEHPPGMLGGKAEGLLRLARAGMRVPPFYVISADAAAARPWESDPEAAQALRTCFDRLSASPFAGVAVRSSAEVEDRAQASHAGLFETVFVEHADALPAALAQVLDSASRALPEGYAATETPPRMAVVLQSRVAPRMAGVLFSANPARALPTNAYVEAVLGLGAGVVDGTKTPSRFYLSLPEGDIAYSEPGAEGPNALDAKIARQLAEMLLALEPAFDSALDIEWAVDDSGLWLLQARPMTALEADPSLRPAECVSSWFFDQRFTEPITPLTRTTLLPRIAAIAIGDALKMRRVPVPDSLLQFYAGQAYVCHALYRAMLAGAPKWFLAPDLRQLFPEHCRCAAPARPSGSLFDYAGCALRAVLREWREVFLNLREWDRFAAALPERIAKITDVPPEDYPSWRAQWDALDALTDALLRLHRWSYLWANYAYRAFRLAIAVFPRPIQARLEQRLQQHLRLPTTEANAALAGILGVSREDPRWGAFLERYGHRSASLDYSVPTWAELAEAGTLEAQYVPLLGAGLPEPPGKTVPQGGFHPLRRFLELREEQRFVWERILAAQRHLLLRAGHLLSNKCPLEALWFLRWEELCAALERGAPVPEEQITLRRHTAYLEWLMPRPAFAGPTAFEAADSPSATLSGLGASAGTAQGRVCVLRQAADIARLPEGPVIAVLPALDPAWTALLPRVQGLVIERGGLLSHAAILAREYGVPLVIGVDQATQKLETGKRIKIDGVHGTIVLLD